MKNSHTKRWKKSATKMVGGGKNPIASPPATTSTT